MLSNNSYQPIENTASRNVIKPSVGILSVIITFFIIGVIGNFLALLILARKKAAKNSKYTLMLR